MSKEHFIEILSGTAGKERNRFWRNLTKARNPGCHNASVSRELEWLCTHAVDEI